MDSDYLFANFLQHSAFRSTDNNANLNRRVGPIRERLFSLPVLEIRTLPEWEHCDCGTKLAVIAACDISMNNEEP